MEYMRKYGKQDETPQVFYFTDAHSTTIFSWLEGSAYETSACNSVHALTLNACSTALQFCRTTIVQHTDRRQEIVQLQVNLFQKPSFLHHLTHNMTRDCSLNSPKNKRSQQVVHKNSFFKTIFVHNLL